MPTIFVERHRTALLRRFEDLDPDRRPAWGHLTAPAMVAHLGDQLRMALGDLRCEPIPGVWRNPILSASWLYLPGPFGKNQEGPPEAFLTPPTTWAEDVATLHALMDRLVAWEPAGSWPEHPILGRMSRRGWGVFTYRHFDHHLKQFSA